MQLPTIHSNGTSAESLTEGLCEAYSALNDAYDKLKQTAPNGRDYYPQGPDAYGRAREEHMGRLDRVYSVMKELEALAIEIQTMGGR